MSDSLTPEQRDRLRQWTQQQAATPVTTGPDIAFRDRLINHMMDELLLLIRANDDLLHGESMTYYAQAIVDMEYFILNDSPHRVEASPQERAMRAHNLIMRLTARAEKLS